MFLRNPRGPQKMPLDWIGLGLLALGIGSLQYVLDQGQQKDWFDDDSIRLFSVCAVAGIAAFVFWSLRSQKPLVDLLGLAEPDGRCGLHPRHRARHQLIRQRA